MRSRGASLECFFKEGLSWGAFEKLARTAAVACDDETQATTPISLPLGLKRSATTLSVLESLPTELLRMVTSELEIPDKVALGLCSQWLWSNFLRELQAMFAASIAPWAGQIIICTSTWLSDLPPALHAAYPELGVQNAKWLQKHREMSVRGMRYGIRGMAPARSWNWDTYRFRDAQDLLNFKLESQYRRALEDKAKGEEGLTEKLQEALDLQIKDTARYNLRRAPHGSAWVLRNLDTRELVRFERTYGRSGSRETIQVAVKGFPWLTLDFAITMRICWAGHLSDKLEEVAANRKRNPLHYGVWAGHRFDVIHAEDLDSKEWRDVTAEVVSEAKGLSCSLSMNGNYGNDNDADDDGDDGSDSSIAVNNDNNSDSDRGSESDSDSHK